MTTQPQSVRSEVKPQMAMLEMISGFWIARAIAKLPDQLKDGPKTAAELAATTETHAASLVLLLHPGCKKTCSSIDSTQSAAEGDAS